MVPALKYIVFFTENKEKLEFSTGFVIKENRENILA